MRRALAALLLTAAALACSKAPACESAEDGCKVVFAYTASAGGKTVDAAPRDSPAEVRLGDAGLMPGLVDGLRGARRGDKRTFAAEPARAFGPRDETAVKTMPKAVFASMGKLRPGMTVQGVSGGLPASGLVVAVTSAAITLDFNHPLAGQTLIYDVEILRLEK